MKLQKLLDQLDKIFEYRVFQEKYSFNGLQVEGKPEINKIAFCVDATTRTIQKAIDNKCDAIIVHHGIFWPSLNNISGLNKKKIKMLLDKDISLVGMHLPLDKHPEIGNNICLIKLIGGEVIKEIGMASFIGKFENKKDLEKVVNLIDVSLKTKSKVFDFSEGKVKKFGVCSGGGASEIYSMLGEGIDMFITGELKYEIIDICREHKISLVESGHYATETLGIKALKEKLEKKFEVETIYIEDKINY